MKVVNTASPPDLDASFLELRGCKISYVGDCEMDSFLSNDTKKEFVISFVLFGYVRIIVYYSLCYAY